MNDETAAWLRPCQLSGRYPCNADAFGGRLMDEAGPGRRVKAVGMSGRTVIREPRAQILHDLEHLFEGIGKG